MTIMSTVTIVPNLKMPNLKIKEFWNKGEGQEQDTNFKESYNHTKST